MNYKHLQTESWRISFSGGVVSQKKEASITLSPPDTEVESYLSTSHIVSCKSPRGVHMKWTRNGTEEITANKGRYDKLFNTF